MLSNCLKLSHPAYYNFLEHYSTCHIHANIDLTYPWFANHETTPGFFIVDTPILVEDSTPEIQEALPTYCMSFQREKAKNDDKKTKIKFTTGLIKKSKI